MVPYPDCKKGTLFLNYFIEKINGLLRSLTNGSLLKKKKQCKEHGGKNGNISKPSIVI